MIGQHKKSIFALAITICFLFTVISNAKAYSTGIQPIDTFRQDSVDVFQLITFNYTQIGGGGSHIQTIKSEGRMIETVRFHTDNPALEALARQSESSMSTLQEDTLGSEERWELIPETKYQYGVDQRTIMSWDLGIYDQTEYVQQRTAFNGSQQWLNVSQYVKGQNTSVVLDPTTYTGTQFVMNLLPAEDIALDWTRKNGAILNSVDSVNTTINCGSNFVEFLSVQESVPLVPDTNLDDGYDILPVNASDFGISAIIGIILAVAVVIFASAFVVSAFNDNPIFDFSSTVNYNADQTVNVNWSTPEINQTELYQEYLAFCTAVGQTPSVEGYYEWSNNHYANIQRISPDLPTLTQNNNWSSDLGEPKKNVLTSIIGFISDIIPIVIVIVIIGAFAIAGIYAFRMIRKKD